MSASLPPVFSFRLQHGIRGPIAFGKFDGIHVCLTAATTGTDKVLIHSPHKTKVGAAAGGGGGGMHANNRVSWSHHNYDVALLNFNQGITAIATGCLQPVAPAATSAVLAASAAQSPDAALPSLQPPPLDADKETLIIGSPTHVLAYMVDDNADLFYNELPGGVTRILVGRFGGRAAGRALAIVGGADSVRGFDRNGVEQFWLLIDGTVSAMALLAEQQLLAVGTQSGRICVYRGDAEHAESVLLECVESAAVTQLVAVVTTTTTTTTTNSHAAAAGGVGQLFAYALADGTLGVYDEAVRLWRCKSKNRVTALASYDLMGGSGGGGGGFSQIIAGWDNGKVDVRDAETGDVLYRLPAFGRKLEICVALGQADYRGNGTADLIVCSGGGEVRGYERSKVSVSAAMQRQQRQQPAEQAELSALMAQKRRLLAELAHYETNVRYNREQQRASRRDDGGGGGDLMATTGTGGTGAEVVGIIPANTRLQIAIYTNIDDMTRPRIEVKISTNNATVIRAVLIFADGIFPGETYIAYPTAGGGGVPSVCIPFVLPRDAAHEIHIKALVGHPHSQQFHVFELSRQLPKFAMYAVLERWLEPQRMFGGAPPGFRVAANWVRFACSERFQRIMLWLNQNFLLMTDLEPDAAASMEAYRVYMCSLHDRGHLVLEFGAGAGTRELVLRVESVQVAGLFVQSLAKFLNVGDVQTVAHFPSVEANVAELFRRIDGYQKTFGSLSVEMAQKKNQERGLVVRIEDAIMHQQ